MSALDSLKGHKTYITAVVAVLTAIAAYIVGDASLIDTIQLVVLATLGATLRSGLKTEINKVQ